MKPLSITNVETLSDTLREELRHSAHARYVNRLCCLLFAACGHHSYEVARCLGESPRSLERWIHKYQEEGIEGLKDHARTMPGSRTLTHTQVRALEHDVHMDPHDLGYDSHTWSGKLLEAHIERKYSVVFSERHCQRLLHHLDG